MSEAKIPSAITDEVVERVAKRIGEYACYHFHSVRAVLEAAAAVCGGVPMNMWQPIETAPKDTWILLWNVAAAQAAVLCGQISSYEKDKRGNDAIWITSGHYQLNLATHWMPLPAAPPKEKD